MVCACEMHLYRGWQLCMPWWIVCAIGMEVAPQLPCDEATCSASVDGVDTVAIRHINEPDDLPNLGKPLQLTAKAGVSSHHNILSFDRLTDFCGWLV